MSKRPHVLVVEDDQHLRDRLMETLEQAGYAMTSARDGAYALSHLRALGEETR